MDTHIVVEEPRSGSWRRQFDSSPTEAQIIFDVIFGIVMPILCFAIDPGILHGIGTLPLTIVSISDYSPLVYGLSALSIPTLVLWLSFRRRLQAWSALLSGILVAGAIRSTLIGIVIFPLSVFFLPIGIGLLGFTPLVTCFVYFRNGMRSFNQSRNDSKKRRAFRSMFLGLAFALALPATAHWQASRMVNESMDQILRGDDASTAAHRLHYLQWYADPDRIAFAYENEKDTLRKERLASAYKVITGDDVEVRLHRLRD